MAHVCSVILVRRSFDIHHEQQNSRMSMARRLLELRQIPLHTIAEKCGYSSTSYFINTFRQYYGVTPHQFAQHSPGTFS